MNREIAELKELSEKYGTDTRKLLDENPSLRNLYVFSGRHENLLEWADFEAGKKLLQAGAGYGMLTGLFLRRGLSVTVLDRDPEELDFVAARFPDRQFTAVCGELRDAAAKGPFDYIVFDGSLPEDCEAAIAAARDLLSPSGMLIVSADNAYGVRAFAGAAEHGTAFGRDRLEKALNGNGDGRLCRYYPEPGRMLPSVIYSDSFLPSAGELSGMVTAYDYPKYTVIDVGKKYDSVIRDGMYPQFADSFLFFWSRK